MAEQLYYYGTGRRKTSVARVRLIPGPGGMTINGKPLAEVFNRLAHLNQIHQPLRVAQVEDKFHVVAKVEGGGISGQAGALSHGIARALVVADQSYKAGLRKFGLLTRDPRAKERKKYGLKRARKAPQYTKR